MSVSDQTTKLPLPENWTPSERDVVVGKGKKWYLHPGNVMLREYVASILAEYSKAHSKTGKSEIISDVVDHVNKTGSFVKRHPVSGKWMYAEERLCREKCSQTFRDALHETYKSSSVAKKNKRRREKEEIKSDPLSSTSTTMTNANKRMRLFEPVVQPMPLLPTIPANLFELDNNATPFSKAKAMRRASLCSQSGGGENLLSLLNDMLTSQLFEEDGNPFEPTPLPDSEAAGYEDTNKIDPMAISSLLDITDDVPSINAGVNPKEDEWKLPPFSLDGTMAEMRFPSNLNLKHPRRETIPTASISAAFAA